MYTKCIHYPNVCATRAHVGDKKVYFYLRARCMADHWPGEFPNVNIYRRAPAQAHTCLCVCLCHSTPAAAAPPGPSGVMLLSPQSIEASLLAAVLKQDEH